MPARFWRFVCGRGWRSQLFVNTVRALDHSAAWTLRLPFRATQPRYDARHL